MSIVLPKGWPRPQGYSNAVLAQGRVLSIAGQIGWTADGRFEALDLAGQAGQALRNIRAILDAAGARPEHLVRLTWYVTDIDAYRASLKAIGVAYRETFGKAYPAMSCVAVTALVEPLAKVEIEATAIIPPDQERSPT